MTNTAELLIKVTANSASAVSAISELEQQTRLLEQIMANTSSTVEQTAAKTQTSAGLWSKLGTELQSVGKMAVGMATGILVADATMGIAARVGQAVTAIDTFGNAVFKVQTVTGSSAQQSSQLVAIFERYGFTADDAAAKLSRFERALAGQDTALDLSESGGKRGAKVLEDFGVQTTDATGRTLPMINVLSNLAGAWQTMDAVSRNAAARSLFGGLGGAGGEQMNVMLSQGKASFDLLAEAVARYGFSLTQENVADVRAFTLAHRDLDMALQGVSIQLGAALMPSITAAADATRAFAQVLNASVMPAIRAIAAFPLTSWLIPATAGALLLGSAMQLVGFLTTPLAGLFSAAAAAIGVEGTASAVAAGEVTALAVAEEAAGAAGAAAAAGGIAALVGAAVGAGLLLAGFGLQLKQQIDDLYTLKDLANQIPRDAMNPVQLKTVELLNKLPDRSTLFGGAAPTTGTDVGDITGTTPVTPPVKAATADLDALKAEQQNLANAAAERKADFDVASLGDAQKLLELKSTEIEKNSALVDYKRQIEDLDRSAVDFAQQRLTLEEQRAVLLAQQAESPLKNQSEDITFQENEIKAQIRATRAGGPAVDTSALRLQLHDLQRQDRRLEPGLLVAEHDVTLAQRTESATATTTSLTKNATDQLKLDIEQAMQPAADAATAAKRNLEDQQHIVDLEKQRYDLIERGFAAQIAHVDALEKRAATALYRVEHPDAFPVFGPNPRERVAQGGPGPTSETAMPAPVINVSVGQVSDPATMWDQMKAQFIAAWNAATQGTPIAGALGGAYNTGSAPR